MTIKRLMIPFAEKNQTTGYIRYSLMGDEEPYGFVKTAASVWTRRVDELYPLFPADPKTGVSESAKIFGVARTPEEADKRLRDRLKEIASKNYNGISVYDPSESRLEVAVE